MSHQRTYAHPTTQQEEEEPASIEGGGGLSVGYIPQPSPSLDASSSSSSSSSSEEEAAAPPPGPIDNAPLLLVARGTRELRPGLVFGDDYHVSEAAGWVGRE